jgi:hypothetical protein
VTKTLPRGNIKYRRDPHSCHTLATLLPHSCHTLASRGATQSNRTERSQTETECYSRAPAIVDSKTRWHTKKQLPQATRLPSPGRAHLGPTRFSRTHLCEGSIVSKVCSFRGWSCGLRRSRPRKLPLGWLSAFDPLNVRGCFLD